MLNHFYVTVDGKEYRIDPIKTIREESLEPIIGFKIQIDGKSRALRTQIHPDEGTANGSFDDLTLESIRDEIKRYLESV